MGGGHSKAQDATDKGRPEKQRIPIVEEAFVQKIAYKCGVTEEELEKKKEIYLDHLSGDPTLKFQEFKCLYRDLSSGKKDDDFLEEYVEAIFRAFDGDKDDQLSFREWQVGFYLLLLLPKEDAEVAEVNKEDFLLAMEIIFRLYDQDGNSVVTKREVHQLRSLLGESAVAARLGPGVTKLGYAVDSIDLNRYEGGINQEQFLEYFSTFVEEKEARV